MAEPISTCHVVAMPYPGRGHINPMLNLCHLILKSRPHIHVTFIITEEWLGLLGGSSSQPPPAFPNLSFRTIPNVIPSEVGRAKDFTGFYEATRTKLEAPVEELLDRLQPPKPAVMLYDTYLTWVVSLGKRRNIPVASLYTMSATVFSIFHHSDLLRRNRHFAISNSSDEEKQQVVDYIPGVPPLRVDDLPTPIHGKGREVLPRALEAIESSLKAQYLLFTSVYELESQVLDTLRQSLPLAIYSIGPAIPYIDIQNHLTTNPKENNLDSMKWLDDQPMDSVLYISQGSFLSVSDTQLDEIIGGVHLSGVRFFWVARGEMNEQIDVSGGKGLVVSWCDQLKVLCHSSVGGYWSHCGWNSTKEGAFAGVPMLTFPIFWDQVTNSKMIVEDWKSGLAVRKKDESLVTREEIARLVSRVMDSESDEGKEMRRRAKKIQEICGVACGEGGSSGSNLDAFVKGILRCS